MVKALIVNNEKDKENLGSISRLQQTIEAEEVEFEVLHHTDLSKEKVADIDPDMIFLTGRLTYVEDLEVTLPDFIPQIKLIRETEIPLLGVCAAHQLIALAYDAKFGRMVEVAEGEEDVKEKGYVKITIRQEDPIFEGIENPFFAYQWHRDEVKDVPDNFELLASSDMCEVQAIKHKERLLYSFQFHPERYDEIHPAGKNILQNFFNLAVSSMSPSV